MVQGDDRARKATGVKARLIHGPSLEGDDSVAVVTIADPDLRPDEPIDASLRDRLIALLTQLDDREWASAIDPGITVADWVTTIVSVLASIVVGGEPAVGRRSRVMRGASSVAPAAPRDVIEWALPPAVQAFRSVRADAPIGPLAEAMRRRAKRIRTAREGRIPRRDKAALVIADEARRIGLPARWSVAWPELLLVGEGRRQTAMMGAFPSVSRSFAAHVTEDKTWTHTFLDRLGLPTPPHRIVADADAAVRAAAELGYPVVVKPADASLSRGVSVDIRDAGEVATAFAHAAEFGSMVIVQPYLDMPDFRAFVVAGRVRIAYRRNAPYVVGDGASTIEALIEAHNEAIAAGKARFPATVPVRVDPHLTLTLSKSGRGLASVPAAGESVVLRGIPLRLYGGYMVEVTDELHPENRRLLERALQLSGLLITGVDFRAESLSIPWHEQRFYFLELNLRPAIWDYEADRVAFDLLRAIFPTNDAARLPTVLAVTRGEPTTADLRRALRARGLVAGVSGPDGVYLDDFAVSREGLPTAVAQERIIDDPTADVAVHVAGPAALAANGLGLRDIACALLSEAGQEPVDRVIADLVRRHSAESRTLPEAAEARIEAICAAAEAAVAARPLPPYAGA